MLTSLRIFVISGFTDELANFINIFITSVGIVFIKHTVKAKHSRSCLSRCWSGVSAVKPTLHLSKHLLIKLFYGPSNICKSVRNMEKVRARQSADGETKRPTDNGSGDLACREIRWR